MDISMDLHRGYAPGGKSEIRSEKTILLLGTGCGAIIATSVETKSRGIRIVHQRIVLIFDFALANFVRQPDDLPVPLVVGEPDIRDVWNAWVTFDTMRDTFTYRMPNLGFDFRPGSAIHGKIVLDL